ncbi:unnamed protein product [Urochloa decumbens]|uniref:Uncharacterized protein n=1 Tax=Urochloa decumbens TaxID=240449 RepID=A0ABC8ZZC8_9POAL
MATMHTNPFSFGLDLSLPQPAATFGSWFSGGVYDRFSSGAAVHAYEAHGNPFAVDPWADLPLPPPAVFDPFPAWAAADIDLAPANTAADSPRTPVYVNPFTADGGAAAVSTDVPAPWECDDDLHDGDDQPANDDDATRKNSTMPSQPQLCASYDDDGGDDEEAILRAQEENPKTRPSPDYLETTQGGRMGPEARAALVRWMSGLCRRHDIAAGTLHRAVSYADRFLSARALSDGHATERRLNLLGAAAVLVAAKYDDQAAARRLSAGEIARHGGFASAGNKEEVAGMERELLAALDYRLGAPTAHTFVEHFTGGCFGGQEGEQLRFRAHGFANASLLHYGCLELRPSAMAVAAVSLAMRTLRPSYRRVVTWGRELEELTGYKREDLERGVDAIRSLVPKDGGNGFEVDKFAVFYADP